jgi:hypothetical protein
MRHTIRHATLIVSLASTLMLAAPANAAKAPIKEILTTQLGWNVNQTKVSAGAPQQERDICTAESKDQCLAQAAESEAAGGFLFPGGVAVETDPASPEYGDVYVADEGNGRIQAFTPSGVFVSMFGLGVNRKGGNVCTKAEENECRAGQPSANGPAGQIGRPMSITADPATGDLYTLDIENHRVEKYTANGEFLLMIGGKVNRKGGNICTNAETSECQAGVMSSSGSTEPGAFKPNSYKGNLLAVGPGGALYVGDEGRVQEFHEDGEFVRNIPVAGTVEALAVGPSSELYLLDEEELTKVIHELAPNGEEVKNGQWPLTLGSRNPPAPNVFSYIPTLAMDANGRLAVSEFEAVGPETHTYGSLLDAVTAKALTSFVLPRLSRGIAFGGNEVDSGFPLYAVTDGHELVAYVPRPVGELLIRPAVCLQGAERESDVTFDCSLNGVVDPWGVGETEVWFEWGRSGALGQRTATQPVANTRSEGEEEPLAPVSAKLEGVLPGEAASSYRLVAHDRWVKGEEVLASSEPLESFSTPAVAPRIVGAPIAEFVGSSSAVLFGQLNPENSSTEYLFEYGPCVELSIPSSCSEAVRTTRVHSSSVYGKIGASEEVTGLQPATTYAFRLSAANRAGGAVGVGGAAAAEGSFQTAPLPAPQAVSLGASAVGVSGATIAGSVNANGAPTTYAFEVGVYEGSQTRYGIVFSGSAGEGEGPVEKRLALTGLQPGTTYSYRVKATSGYGEATGAALTFMTAGLPSVLVVPVPLAMLPVPAVSFPVQSSVSTRVSGCKHGYRRNSRGGCVRSKPTKSRRGNARKATGRAHGKGAAAKRK